MSAPAAKKQKMEDVLEGVNKFQDQLEEVNEKARFDF